MECRQVQTQLTAYLDGLLEERQRQAVAEHLARCETCAAEAQALQRVDRLLRAVEWEEPPAYLWQSIRSRIESEAQRRVVPFWRQLFTLPRLALGGAIAAAVLAAVVFWRAPEPMVEEAPVADSGEALLITHHTMRWGDPLSDKAALGVVLASRSTSQEVP